MTRFTLAALAALTLSVLLLSAANTQRTDAVFPGTNGKIVFLDQMSGDNRLTTMNPDGSDRTQITTPGFYDLEPAAGPTPDSIVFRGLFIGDAASDGIWYTDGAAMHKIPGTHGNMYDPSWAPTGDRVAFDSAPGLGAADVYAINLDGSALTNITNTPGANEYSPAWSPLGDKIAYVSQMGGPGDIWVMNADGTGQTNLTNTPNDEDSSPAWSPDGQRIIFDHAAALITAGGENLGATNVAVMNADGTGFELITNDPELHQYDPTFSPDGMKIAFGQLPKVAASSLSSPKQSIIVANADGTDAVDISPPGAVDFYPSWGVDELLTPSPTPSPTATPAAEQRLWGDSDCDGEITTRDNQALLRFVLQQVPLSQTQPCPVLGAMIEP